MDNKIYFSGGWYSRPELDAIQYRRSGYYDIGVMTKEEDIKHTIRREELNQLIDFLFQNGYIKPQLGENRTEDIKIINRLIDVIEKKIV